MNIGAEDVWPLVLDFIKKYVGKSELKAFKKHFSIEVDESEDVLVKAGGMQALLQSFFKSNKKAYKAFVKAKKAKKTEDSSSSSEEEEKPAKAKKAKKEEAVGKKRKRSDSQASATAEKEVSKKRKRTESMNSVKSNGSTGGGPVTRRMSQDAAEASSSKKEAKSASNQPYLFKRIDTSKYDSKISEKFADNSFEAKARFGKGGDSYGSWSNSKLADKRGASFIKEKNKMKNRQSHASGAFNALAVNSIKF